MERTVGHKPGGRIERVTWKPDISLHVAKLDSQHQKLYSITNRLIDLYEQGAGDTIDVLADLVHYSIDHFRDETLIMFESRYPGLDAQKTAHDRFVEKMQEFLRGYADGQEQLTYELLNYCRNWLVAHITNDDTKFAAYLVKTGLKDKYWNR